MRRLPAIALSLTTVAALSVACQNGKEPDSTGQPAPQTTSAAPTQTPTTTVTPKLVATQDSAGDPYVPGDGNGGYDVQHYDLKLKIVPTNLQKTLDGVAEIRAKANQELTAFNLDLTDLNVSEVKVNGAEASFDRAGSELVVKPSSPLPGGADFTVSVAYSGTPEPVDDPILGPYGWIKTSDGVVVACQPSGAHTWYPSNDHPSDKATFDIELTVPQKLTGISNGESGPSTTSGGFTTTKWQVKQPMATYLATISVGDYKVKKGVTKGGIPILVAVDSSVTSTRIEDFYAHKSKITDEWVELFGEYPFDSTGGLVDNAAIGFALETQTRSVYGDFPVGGSIIAHELAHQWFGDSVSVTQWKDIWLNEGFASYAEWIWESKNGGASVQRQFDSYYQTPDSPNWRVLPGDPGRTQMFDTFAVYNRGAMTLHALRTKIGDDKFFELLRTWAKNYRYAYATTEQFVDLAEQISGSELSSFFQAWLYTPRRPQL